jgi:hypothetical protein
VSSAAGVSLVEHFVLQEADSHALLWELAAAWTDNGTPEQRTQAVPVLRDAVVVLEARNLVEVRDFPSWPPHTADATDMSGPALLQALADPSNWLWMEERTSLLTVSLTEAGIPYL